LKLTLHLPLSWVLTLAPYPDAWIETVSRSWAKAGARADAAHAVWLIRPELTVCSRRARISVGKNHRWIGASQPFCEWRGTSARRC